VDIWFPRDTIAAVNNIGAGTVSSIIANYKAGLEELDFDSIRQLAVETRQHGLNISELASHFRLHNYFIKSGAAENKIESFIANVSSGDVSPEKIIELVYQLHEISKSESIPLDQVSKYVSEKLEEKQKIDEQIKEAGSTLQTKNVKAKTINEHMKLNEKLSKYGLSMQDINKLVKLLVNAKRYDFDAKKFVGKLSNIKELEKREKKLVGTCAELSTKEARYKEITPLANLIWDLHIGKSELISFKVAVNETAETYGLTPSSAALDVINLIIDHNKKGQLKKELSALCLQKYTVEQLCLRQSQVIMALTNLQSHGVTEEQIISLNHFLESNGYKASSYTTTK